MADPALTGILLVGGASQRFGSPKALARFRGETLAERAWRLLAEACDEVIAVGKAADALPVPFPLLDDGTTSRAPVHGVLAGLRAARYAVCVVLPVDCPLVTTAALRTLGETMSVSPSGPLPGAYPRTAVSILAKRVERGELSLRGVNTRTADLPAELFADVDTPAELAALERIGEA